MSAGRAGAGDARRAVRNLYRLSLVTHDPADPVRSVRMHMLAQRSTAESLGPAVLADVIGAAAEALLAVWPEGERDDDLGQVLRACAGALLTLSKSAPWRPRRFVVARDQRGYPLNVRRRPSANCGERDGN